MNKKALQLAARFALPPNSLGYCGDDTAPQRFNTCVIKGDCTNVEEEITNFIVLHPYLKTIAQLKNKNKFDYDVIEAYCLGNDLLDTFKVSDYDILLENFLEQGVPSWFVDDLKKNKPKKFIPHHLFQVLYVGIGKGSGLFPYNLASINSCMIRWGRVTNINKNKLTTELNQIAVDNNKFVLEFKIENIEFNKEFLGDFKKGDTIAVHWSQVIKVLTNKEQENLEHWTKEIINIVKPDLQK